MQSVNIILSNSKRYNHHILILKFSIMIMTTELAAGGINHYGSTQKEEELLVVGIPGAMMDRNHHHTSSHKHPSRPSSWKTKKFMVLGIIGGMAAAVVVATVFWSVLGDSSSGPAARTGQSILGRRKRPPKNYHKVMVINQTPYDVQPRSRLNPSRQYTHVGYLDSFYCFQSSHYLDDPGFLAGQTWTAPSRGSCLVNKIVAVLSLPDGRGVLQCTNYVAEYPADTVFSKYDPVTADSVFYIQMGGGDGCCVQKHTRMRGLQRPECGSKQTEQRNPDYDYNTTYERVSYDSIGSW